MSKAWVRNKLLIILVFVLAILLTSCSSGHARTNNDIVAENTTPKYTIRVVVDFVSNLMFSKYDVDFSVDGAKIGTLSHGTDGEYSIELEEGNHKIVFAKHGVSSVSGEATLALTCDAVVSYKISCYNNKVDVETKYIDYIADTSTEYAKINCASIDFHGKEYESVISVLKGLGFTNIQEKPIYDVKKWDAKEGLVEEVVIDGNTKYSFGDSFLKSADVIVSYHTPQPEGIADSGQVSESLTSTTLTVYPINSTSKYNAIAKPPQDAIWTAEELDKKLGGIVFYLDGIVEEVLRDDESGIDHFIFATDYGNAIIFDFYHALEREYEKDNPEFFEKYIAESNCDYSFPEIGTSVRIIGIFGGYASKYDMPIFYYGANEYIVEKLLQQLSDPTPTSKPSLSYTTNDQETAKKGNSGVFAYCNRGKAYYIYYIIDFDEGYVYRFIDGNYDSTCDRLRIESGDLNSGLRITYHDGDDTWPNWLHFRWKNQPDHLILVDNDDFEYDYYTTNLEEAIKIRDTKEIIDY